MATQVVRRTVGAVTSAGPGARVKAPNSLALVMPDTPLAIVDVETTGQSAAYGRVIEIAILRVEGGEVVEQFQSLVNPERYITPMIEALTGISNDAVAAAPTFRKIARKVQKILDGALFVAHNARFDYSFIKNEFRSVGIPFSARCLCTVKLSRRLFREHRHHDLSSLIERHGLSCESRHRAMGDAMAVLDFLKLVQEEVETERREAAIRDILKSSTLPDGVDKPMVDELPESPGVYLFYGKAGELLYVGKSLSIRDRVRSHFSMSETSPKEQAICRQVCRVECHTTAGELGALLLESKLIKEKGPIYNSAARQKRSLIVARRKVDRKGYHTVRLEEIDALSPPDAETILGVFKHRKQAQEFLTTVARSHDLCNKLLGLEQARGYCFSYHLKQCRGACAGEEPAAAYNLRVEEAFAERRVKSWPFEGGIAIEERSENGESGEVFLVENWCLLGSFRVSEFGPQDPVAGSHRFDYDSYKILSRYILSRSGRRNIRTVDRPSFEALLSHGTLSPA